MSTVKESLAGVESSSSAAINDAVADATAELRRLGVVEPRRRWTGFGRGNALRVLGLHHPPALIVVLKVDGSGSSATIACGGMLHCLLVRNDELQDNDLRMR